MTKTLSIELLRFKQIREELQLTQSAFQKELELSSSTSDIERGRTKLSGKVVMRLLEKYQINPLWLYGESERKYLNPTATSVLPKVITVDSEGNENILMVNVKAAAGYPNNIQDGSWYETLPVFNLPMTEYRNASFRAFQVSGDSMYPLLHPGEWVLAQGVESIDDINDGALCVVILQDSVLVKKIQKGNAQSILISQNPEYPPLHISNTEIMEVWKVHSKISSELDTLPQQYSLEQIQESLEELRQEIRTLKK